jgi:16S rRNA U1498 N3-methylase RsmE
VVNDYDRVVVFDREKNKNVSQSKGQNWSRSVLWVVGPEWWLSDKDYEALWDVTNDIDILSLGDSVLRMETAAIVWGWMLVSSSWC